MISMQGVPSALIAKNESWVRKQAQALVRHLPSNVEKADLIQVGLIAVAQASIGFQWEGDRDSPEATEAFLRYARARVKGAGGSIPTCAVFIRVPCRSRRRLTLPTMPANRL
jgi:RNA polymerase sigma factor for flagellar operon FliA